MFGGRATRGDCRAGAGTRDWEGDAAMLSPASRRSPGARPGPEAAQSRFNRRPQRSRSACPRAGTGHLGGAGSRQRQCTRRRHLTRESATWPLRTFAGLRDHPLFGLTLHPLKFTSQIKPPKGDPGGQCVPAAPQAPCTPSAGDSDLGRAAAGRWARRVGPGRQWSSKQEDPESSFSLVSS